MKLYESEQSALSRVLGDAFGDDKPKIVFLLILACQWGAGDALAGLMLSKASKDTLAALIGRAFPTFKIERYWSTQGMALNLLYHKTGDEKIDRVLRALERAACAGTASFEKYLEETKNS